MNPEKTTSIGNYRVWESSDGWHYACAVSDGAGYATEKDAEIDAMTALLAGIHETTIAQIGVDGIIDEFAKMIGFLSGADLVEMTLKKGGDSTIGELLEAVVEK